VSFNFDGLQDFAEGFLSDTLQVFRDQPGTRNDTFNDETGDYTPSTPTKVWEGLGAVQSLNYQQRAEQLAAVTDPTTIALYRALIPIDAPELLPNDRVYVKDSVRDKLLRRRSFYVTDASALSSFAVIREVRLRPVKL
jgi:hypothetical protein